MQMELGLLSNKRVCQQVSTVFLLTTPEQGKMIGMILVDHNGLDDAGDDYAKKRLCPLSF